MRMHRHERERERDRETERERRQEMGETERQTNGKRELYLNEPHNCCLMHYDHLSGLQARMKNSHEHIMTHMKENTHTQTHTHMHTHTHTHTHTVTLSVSVRKRIMQRIAGG